MPSQNALSVEKMKDLKTNKAIRKRIWNLKFPCNYEAIGSGEMVRANELSEYELECKEQHLQLAMDTVLRLVQQLSHDTGSTNHIVQIHG